MAVPHTVVETPMFVKLAAACMTDDEREAAILMVADDPTCGDVVRGTGGIHKVRFAVGGRGKSGGVRIMYLFGGHETPVFMLTVFAKSSVGNLSKAQRNALADVARQIVQEYHPGVKP